MDDGGVVIIGGGQAASQLAASLRENGYGESIRMVAEEKTLPYQRPPLSKAFLKGEVGKAALLLRAEGFYVKNNIDVLLGARAVSVDRHARRVHLVAGHSLSYSRLVFATGSRNRRLDLPGSEFDGICYLRSLAEAEAIKGQLEASRRVVVIGGGFVGLELACAARDLGAAVVVLEAALRPMGRAISPEMSDYLAKAHEMTGIRLLLGAAVAGFRGDGGHVKCVVLADGSLIEADFVLLGVGASADMELARDCGLRAGNGIEVDRHLMTSDPLVSAIGDCASFEGAPGQRLRLESVQNAVDHARCLAAGLAGRVKAYDSVPWFWSDQGAHRLQIAGLTGGYDTAVVRGDVACGRFSVFCYADGRLLGVESMNQASDHMMARRLLASRVALAPEQAADQSFDLKSHLLAEARSLAGA